MTENLHRNTKLAKYSQNVLNVAEINILIYYILHDYMYPEPRELQPDSAVYQDR